MSLVTRWITGRACLTAVASLVSLTSFAQTLTHDDATAHELATHVCSRCHGVDGDSPSPLVPRLAAQQASYLKAEILDFKTHERSELLARDVMQGQVAGMDDATALALAQYYARQPPAPGVSGNPRQIAKGKALFEQGSESQTACATCHGLHAEGFGIFPRLAGQHAVYLQYQLRIKRHGLRNTSVMRGMIDDLSAEDMANLAAYLESIP